MSTIFPAIEPACNPAAMEQVSELVRILAERQIEYKGNEGKALVNKGQRHFIPTSPEKARRDFRRT